MKQPVGIFQRGQRLQRVLDWLTSPWPPVDGDWRPPETLLHRFIKEELGEHFVIDPIPYSKGLQENSLALEFMEPPLTTKVWWRPLWEQLNGPKLPPSVMHPVPAQMDELHAQMSRMVWAVSRGDAFVFELRPYSVKYNVRAGTVGGKLRYLTNPEGSLRDLAIAAFLHCLQELNSPRLCACPECQGVFVRTGRRRFCSGRCAHRATSRTYRQKNPDKHRHSAALSARRRYEREITQGGKRNIKISMRRRKYPDAS